LCGRFRRLTARQLQHNKITVAIARELTGFVWAIMQAQGARLAMLHLQSVREALNNSSQPKNHRGTYEPSQQVGLHFDQCGVF